MKKAVLFLQIVFVVVFVAGLLTVSAKRPRILVVHSEGAHTERTDNINEGVDRIFRKHANLHVCNVYMDVNRSARKEQLECAAQEVRDVMSFFQPNLVVLVDDIAQRYVGKGMALLQKTPLVFAGVKGDIADYGYERQGAKVTGVLERIPLPEVKRALKYFHRGVPAKKVELYVLGDTSFSSKSDVQFLKKFSWGPYQVKKVYLMRSFAEWQKTIELLNAKKNAIILLLDYSGVQGAKGNVSSSQMMAWLLHKSKLPILGTNSGSVSEGCGLAIGASAVEQGELAALQALQVIRGTHQPKDIPIARNSLFLAYINKKVLDRYKVRLPYVYTSLARLGNHCYNFFPSYGVAGLEATTQGVI